MRFLERFFESNEEVPGEEQGESRVLFDWRGVLNDFDQAAKEADKKRTFDPEKVAPLLDKVAEAYKKYEWNIVADPLIKKIEMWQGVGQASNVEIARLRAVVELMEDKNEIEANERLIIDHAISVIEESWTS